MGREVEGLSNQGWLGQGPGGPSRGASQCQAACRWVPPHGRPSGAWVSAPCVSRGPRQSKRPQVPGAYLIVLVPELWSALSNVCHVQRQNGKCQSPRPLVMLTEMVFHAYCIYFRTIPPSLLVVFNCCLYTLEYDSNLQERDQFSSEPTFIILFATK